MAEAGTHDHSHEHAHDHPGHAQACCGKEEEAAARARPEGRTFLVNGLDCAEEVAVLKNELGPAVGGEEHLFFDILNGHMTVAETARPLTDREIFDLVARTGMRAEPWSAEEAKDDAQGERHRRVQAWLTTLSGLAVLAGFTLHVILAGGLAQAIQLMAGHGGKPTPLPEMAAYALAIVLGARFAAVKAWYAVRGLRADMNLLMMIAVAGAVALGEWFEAATVTFLFALSLTLESWSVGRARRAIAALLDLAPPTVRLKPASGAEREIPAGEARIGDRFVVRPGDRIALDGRVAAGTSSVDQAPITGESVPVLKEPGDEVFAGTINGDGALEVTCTKAARDTTLARIIRMVEQAHSRRARVEQWVERFAHVYTPIVILLAILVALVPPLALGAPWGMWFYRALVLLVIACPCALVISTPVSIVAALAASARNGVLIKGGSYIELPSRLKAIAFDKTGTLSRGEPEVVRVIPINGHTEEDLLARAAALESQSSHPLAKAILARAEAHGITPEAAAEMQIQPGKGVSGRFNGTRYWLGSHRFLLERGQETPAISQRADALEGEGYTVIVVGTDDHVCGLIAVADAVRPEARRAVDDLRAAGVAHLIMLTGDNRVTAEVIARAIAVDEVRAELLPEDKVAVIDGLVATYDTVAMVGDGVNDAPAMARASFGIAMGAMGSDAAIETADIALMTDDLSKIPWLVRHSRRTFAVIRQNIVFAIGVKVLFVGLTFAGLATLWGAIAADVGASLLVVANALRLLGSGGPGHADAGGREATSGTPAAAGAA